MGTLNYLKIALDDKRIIYLVIEKESCSSLHLWGPMLRRVTGHFVGENIFNVQGQTAFTRQELAG